MQTEVILIVVALIFSAFFSGMEIAFVSANKLRLEVEKKQSRNYNHIASLFLRSPGQYLSTILVGNNIALVVFSLFMSRFLGRALGIDNYALETLISTVIIIFTAEFLPKAIVKANPNFYLRTFAVPLYVCYVVFYPVTKFTTWLSTWVFRLFGRKIDRKRERDAFSKIDLASLVEETGVPIAGGEESQQQDNTSVRLFQNALGFSEQRVRDCMVPRTEVEAIDIDSSVGELTRLFIESGYSRIPVFEGTVDRIVGYTSLKSLFTGPATIREIVQPTIDVPESMSQRKLLQEFTRTRRSLAVVLDEFGGTAGMVTLEDLLEQIFGEIEDEHDADYLVEKETAPGEYVLAGRLEVDYLNEKYDLGIPESDQYDTLAGYILFRSEDIPRPGDTLHADRFRIRVLRTSASKIELVHLTAVPEG